MANNPGTMHDKIKDKQKTEAELPKLNTATVDCVSI